jgi:hypothetical protein
LPKTPFSLKPDGDVLSERSGDFQTADVVLDAPAFIPAKSKARMALSASYRYPSGGRDRDRTGDPLLAKHGNGFPQTLSFQ